MVKYSLRNMIEKYPYFFDKRPISNFYKITKVYNENFKLIKALDNGEPFSSSTMTFKILSP